MGEGLGEIYGRALPFARAVPLAFALPVVAEFAQHVVEVQAGMYSASGSLTPDEQRVRLIFGGFKVLSILVVVLFAVRLWSFGHDARRAARPTLAMFKGLAIVFLVQVGGELLLLGLGALIGRAIGSAASQEARIALAAGPLLLWLLLATLLLPWFVGLLTEDQTMTLRRSVAAVRGRMWASFGLLIGAYLPTIAVHYALGYGAMGRSEALVWVLMAVDSLVVAFIAVILASAYFTIYRRAADRTVAEPARA